MRIYLGILLSLLLAGTAHAFTSSLPTGGGIAGGTCTGGQVMGGISSSGVPTCVTPSAAGSYPAGSPPQIGGFSAANVAESETVSGDFTYARGGANSYVATVVSTNGHAFTAISYAAIPLSIANGGLGSSTAPSIGQIEVASSTTAFTPVSMSGDCTILSTGAITCTKLNGVAPGTLYSATTPLSIANGGRGSATAPTAGQIDVAQSTTALGFVTMSGDATIAATGAITVTKTNGVAFTGLATAAIPLSIANGGTGSATAPSATGQLLISQTGLTTYTPQTVTGDMTISAAGATVVTKTNGVAFTSAATTAIGTSGATIPLLSTANTWGAAQTFPASGIKLTGSSTGVTTFTSANASATNYTLTVPAATDTIAELGQTQTFTGTNTFSVAPVMSGASITAATIPMAALVNSGVTATSYANANITVNAQGLITAASNGSAGGALPSGAAPQFIGYPATTGTTGEAETLAGDATMSRTSAGTYTITVTKTSGTAFTALATAAVPLSIANGGLGNTTAPVAGQIDIAQSATLIQPKTVSGDATITSAGALTVTKTNGVAFTAMATTANPTTSGQILGANTTTPEWETVSGGAGSCAYTRTAAGAYTMACPGYAPLASPNFTGTIGFPDGSTWTSTGPTIATTSTFIAPDGATWKSTGLASVHQENIGWPAQTNQNDGLSLPHSSINAYATGTAPNVYGGGNISFGLHGVSTGGFVDDANFVSHFAAGQANSGYEWGVQIYQGETIGNAFPNGTRGNYMALRTAGAGSGAGLFVESGVLDILRSDSINSTAILFGQGGFLTSEVAGNVDISEGIKDVAGTWQATQTSYALLQGTGATIGFWSNTGQTAGTSAALNNIANVSYAAWGTPDAIAKRTTPAAGTYTAGNSDCGSEIDIGSGTLTVAFPNNFEPIQGCAIRLYGFNGGLVNLTIYNAAGMHLLVSNGVGDVVNPSAYAAVATTGHSATLRFIAHLIWGLDVN